VTWAEFEEKEYETAAVGELMRADVGGNSFAFSAGQVLEKVVGYDAAAAPSAAHVIWRIVQLPRPVGVRLLPSLWAPGAVPRADQLPTSPVMLVLQFKRPEYLYGASARQWRFWEQPYFRFHRDAEQQRVLYALERNVGNDALIRYAAPAFWRRSELEAAHLRGQVTEQSGFVMPSRLVRHRWWTYVRPGIDGRANPRGTHAPFETRDDLLRALLDRPMSPTDLVASDVFGEHLERVGAAAGAAARAPLRRSVQRWQDELRIREPNLAETTIRQIGAVAMVSSVTSSIGAIWAEAATG
jgi:hypothetical protein